MKLKQFIFSSISIAFLAISFQSCAKYNSPILVERGAKPYEREFHLKTQSFGIDRNLHKPYMQGYLAEGMTADMVALAWGPADKESEDGMMWDYLNKKGENISTVIFIDSTVAGNEKVKVVKDIQGDRYGGSLPPQN